MSESWAVSESPASPRDLAWRRVHPLTPLLRGGFVLIAAVGWLVTTQAQKITQSLVLHREGEETPLELLVREGWLVWAGIALVVIAAAIVLGAWLSWRCTDYRIIDRLIETRRGVLSRQHRQAPLDRVQSVEVTRRLLARLFGLATLTVEVAGQGADLELAYLRLPMAEAARDEVLRKRARVRDGAAGDGAAGDGSGVASRSSAEGQHVDAATDPGAHREASSRPAPPRDPALARVRVPLGMLLASTVLATEIVVTAVVTIVAASALLIWQPLAVVVVLPGLLPVIFALGSIVLRRLNEGANYSIEATDSGLRVRRGFTSITTDTIGEGRVHAIAVRQPMLWRPFGWWRIEVSRVGSIVDSGGAMKSTTILPIGERAAVFRVLHQLLPAVIDERSGPVIDAGLTGSVPARRSPRASRPRSSAGERDPFTVSRRHPRIAHPLQHRRLGFALLDFALVMRRGRFGRAISIVPYARIQSASLTVGPIARPLGLGRFEAHLVPGPVRTHLGGFDAAILRPLLLEVRRRTLEAVAHERKTELADQRSDVEGRTADGDRTL